MSTQTQNACLRCLKDCTPLANLSSDEQAKSFVCVGLNHPQSRTVPQDRFTLCWKNNVIDERGHWDKRDLLDTASVILQALSTDENIRVNQGVEESGMQQINFIGG
jgi:hypothetical protein